MLGMRVCALSPQALHSPGGELPFLPSLCMQPVWSRSLGLVAQRNGVRQSGGSGIGGSGDLHSLSACCQGRGDTEVCTE